MNIVMDENNDAVTNAQPDISSTALEQEVTEAKQINTYNTGSDINNETAPEVAACMLPAFSYAGASLPTKPPAHQATKSPGTPDKSQNFWTVEQKVTQANQTDTYNTGSAINNETTPEVAACMLPAFSYASASRPTKPPVHQVRKSPGTSDKSQNFWTPQLKKILLHHENGACTLIIMRGLPGSGKTYLAKKIIDAIYYTTQQHYHTHILSTDDYFMCNGVYMYDKWRIPEAHEWNKNRARKAMTEGLSPVIIDNTNIEIWEMEYYVVQGVSNGYIIEVVEPNTPWARNAYQLFKRNSHNVPLVALRRKLDSFQGGITGDYLMHQFKLQYSPNNTPPVLRKIPPFSSKLSEESVNLEPIESVCNETISLNEIQKSDHENTQSCLTETTAPAAEVSSDTVDHSEKLAHSSINLEKLAEIEKCLEEMEKVEKEWDDGDGWDDNSQQKSQDSANSDSVINSKPQRENKMTNAATTEKFLTSNEVCQDWSKCSMFLPSWGESSTQVETSMPVVEKKTSSTCIEYGDTDMSTSKNPLKVIIGVPRNINEYHIAVDKKMPEKWMLDKSTSTNNEILTDTFRCQNEEQHFAAFRKLFKNIARSDLRDIFDNCCGDVNWAVEIVLDGVASNQLDIVNNDDCSDTEIDAQIDNVDLCQCLSAYDIIPNSSSPPIIEENVNPIDNAPSSSRLKGKKGNSVSENSMQLKRQIEQNVVISDNHYSEHCLKIRKFRRGECYNEEVENANGDESNTTLISALDRYITGSDFTSTSPNVQHSPCHSTPSTSKVENVNTEMCDEDSSASDEIEKTVNVNLGREFIAQLDEMFGRRNMDYPASVIPKVNMPVSLLNEINALWMESLMNQLEEDAKQSEIMVQQDEEFARQLAMKEAELLRSGKEPEVPDFKEIMDMDFALSLYHKDVAEWRNTMPDDLAAKLTRDKLYNLFPEVSKDILSELLMAHDNNFQETVEGLLISTGKSEILERKNGISKFVMEKEMERQEKLLEEEKKTLSEVEWPLLPKIEQVDMSVVQRYRDEAEKHLQSRNMNYQKAEEYIRRGITQVATYYNGIAAYHKEKYELANSMAAATLMQVHAANASDNATIDLHYLRVGEAKESVDLFIDTHIQKLRELQDRNSVKFHTLFFITGRGLHSSGRPRIKPAVKKRLAERGLTFSERNPGLLTAKVCADDKLSYQVA
ncbi:NEDD4-binding protein 2 isoform X2 [Maniola jurtina]|nr:NEDD4-binding protein 2 isoform X2 [Maniola jurtina]